VGGSSGFGSLNPSSSLFLSIVASGIPAAVRDIKVIKIKLDVMTMGSEILPI
jgi:hypothetical protein